MVVWDFWTISMILLALPIPLFFFVTNQWNFLETRKANARHKTGRWRVVWCGTWSPTPTTRCDCARHFSTATADLCGHKKMVKGQEQFALTAIRDVRNGQDTDMNALRWRAVHLKSSPSYHRSFWWSGISLKVLVAPSKIFFWKRIVCIVCCPPVQLFWPREASLWLHNFEFVWRVFVFLIGTNTAWRWVFWTRVFDGHERCFIYSQELMCSPFDLKWIWVPMIQLFFNRV